jgi:uncharacterized membrane protein
VDWLQVVGLIISDIVKLMQNTVIWNGISWWSIFISISAFSVGIGLFKFYYGVKGSGGGNGKS